MYKGFNVCMCDCGIYTFIKPSEVELVIGTAELDAVLDAFQNTRLNSQQRNLEEMIGRSCSYRILAITGYRQELFSCN